MSGLFYLEFVLVERRVVSVPILLYERNMAGVGDFQGLGHLIKFILIYAVGQIGLGSNPPKDSNFCPFFVLLRRLSSVLILSNLSISREMAIAEPSCMRDRVFVDSLRN